MKALKKILLILLCCVTNFYAQPFEFEHLNGPNGGVIGDLAIDSHGNIYAGAYAFWISYSGLYKSTDNGNSWQKLITPDPRIEVYAIYIDENDHIYVGTNFGGRIYRSTDGGVTWDNPREGYNTGECWAFGKSLDGVMFAGDGQYGDVFRLTPDEKTWEYSETLRPLVFATDSESTVYCGSFWGLFATKDNGENWAQSNFLNNRPVAAVFIDQFEGIYCGTGYYDNGNGVYYSPDKGVTWNHLGLDSMVVLSLAFDSKDRLYAGTLQDGVFRLEDNGSWTQLNEGLDSAQHPTKRQVFRMKINKDDHIFIGSENEGVYRSTDEGNNFEQVGLPISKVQNVIFGRNNLVYTSTPTGVQSYNPVTRNWTNLGLVDVEYIAFGPDDILYAATWADGIFKSTDYGNTWLETSQNRDSLTTVYNIKVLSDGTVIASTEKDVRRSTDGGNSWEIKSPNPGYFNAVLELDSEENIYLTGFDENEESYMLYKSVDKGITFEKILPSFGTVYKNSFTIDNQKNIYLGCSEVGSTLGVNKSTPPYSSWNNIFSIGAPTVYFYDNTIYTSSNSGLYFSEDQGDSWSVMLEEINGLTWPNDIRKNDDGYLFVGTDGMGLFKSTTPTSVENEQTENIAKNFRLAQNYPNPFNPTTTINFSLTP